MKSKFAYVGIRVTNLQKSVDFCTKILGMNVISQSKIDQTKGSVVVLQCEKGGPILELNYYEKDSPYNVEYSVGEGLDHRAFKVDNLEKALEETRRAGHKPVLELKAEGGRWACIEDPDGIWIELFE
ncbi:VOC family protein [Candidatus Bathyarchaeota archaeon]|nr:VOC family protein [Candidatus Bathyarchaeota archaeon]